MTSFNFKVMDSFCNDLFLRLADESGHLCQINNKKPTLNAKEVESATKSVFLVPNYDFFLNFPLLDWCCPGNFANMH